MLPDFIGIGAPKAGTTWLFECLRHHPQIFMAPTKETNFFDYGTIDGRLDEYEVHFAAARSYETVGEISTRYLSSTRAPKRIHEILPDVRLFASLRNPIDQAYSNYWHLRRQNFHQWGRANSSPSFEQALEQYPEKLLEPAHYWKHLQRWLEYFDGRQVLVLFYDDIQKDRKETLEKLFSFLGVDASFEPDSIQESGPRVRRGTSPRSPRLEKIHLFLHDNMSRHIYLPLKRKLGIVPATWIKDTFRARELMEFLFHRTGYPKMADKTREVLFERFADDVRSLANYTGCNLSHWR